jgi:hypothetical protein
MRKKFFTRKRLGIKRIWDVKKDLRDIWPVEVKPCELSHDHLQWQAGVRGVEHFLPQAYFFSLGFRGWSSM